MTNSQGFRPHHQLWRDTAGIMADRAGAWPTSCLAMTTWRHTSEAQFRRHSDRYANRIAGGDLRSTAKPITCLEHKPIRFTVVRGFDKQVCGCRDQGGPVAGVTMELTSPAGDQGYPGTLRSGPYMPANGRLTIDYDAATDAPTIVNITKRNLQLGGEGGRRTYSDIS